MLLAVHWMNIGPELDSGGAIFKALYLFLMKFLSGGIFPEKCKFHLLFNR